MTIVKLSHSIKSKVSRNDKIYTPQKLVQKHIDLVRHLIMPTDVLFEPFAGQGAYLDGLRTNFPTNEIKQTEIDNGTDFFEFNEYINCIVSNPPYSMIDNVLKHSVELNPRVISYLIGVINLTPKRIYYMNQNGYFIENLFICKVRGWFSMTVAVTFSNQITKNCVEFERTEYNNKFDIILIN